MDNIRYVCASAEETGLPCSEFDLVTVATALHYFEFDAFWKEVDRLLVPGSVLAVWTYDVNRFEGNDAAHSVVKRLYHEQLCPDKYWSERRAHVDNRYESIVFPWQHSLQRKVVDLKLAMPLIAFVKYTTTWSGMQKYREVNDEAAMQELVHTFKRDLMEAFGSEDETDEITVIWPIHVIMCRKPSE